LHPIRRGVPEDNQRIANYFFVTVPRCSFYLDLLEEVGRRVQRNPHPREDYDVLYTTGPDVVTSVVHSAVRWTCAVTIVPRPKDQLYFRHDASGSWRQVALG
jgi:hypothetical protein